MAASLQSSLTTHWIDSSRCEVVLLFRTGLRLG
jgi:hypothetical protein